jgi:hypothetical protein
MMPATCVAAGGVVAALGIGVADGPGTGAFGIGPKMALPPGLYLTWRVDITLEAEPRTASPNPARAAIKTVLVCEFIVATAFPEHTP